jgi:parallel beta-helix repeat protein
MIRSLILLGVLIPLILIGWGQGCSPAINFSMTEQSAQPVSQVPSLQAGTQMSGNGGTYDGKIRVLHHTVRGFTCEGKEVPESILIRENDVDWVIIKNSPSKCAVVNHEGVLGVLYDPGLNQAHFEGKLYVPPHPYLVKASENPNLPDVDTTDGICADTNGVCSLRAAIDQAGPTSLTEPVLITVPAGVYTLTGTLTLSSVYTNNQSVTIRGEDPGTTILDGGNSVLIFKKTISSAEPVNIENLTFQNGNNGTAFSASAILPEWRAYDSSVLNIINCTFTLNKSNSPIYGGPGAGHINIYKSRFTGNQMAAIQVFAVSSLLVEESSIVGNGQMGIWVDNATPNVTIRSSTIASNGSDGIHFHKCSNCLIENTTVFNNAGMGISILSSLPGPQYDVAINNSTIYQNGTVSGANFQVAYVDAKNRVTLRNSISAMNNATKSNCVWLAGPYKNASLDGVNSLFDDGTCMPGGSGNLFVNPKLSGLANNGGSTLTLLPLPGSPAIDAGNNLACASLDQRGLPRPVENLGAGARCDIGAVELQ